MLQHSVPDDFVIATGETHSVREFAERAFGHVGIELDWEGEGVEELGRDRRTGTVRVRVDPRYFRPTEVELAAGRCDAGPHRAGLEAQRGFRPASAHDGRRRGGRRPGAAGVMHPASRVYVAGHGGMVGSAIVRLLKERGYRALILPERAHLDLTAADDVDRFFRDTKPEYVFLAAAKVGGILANMSYPVDFLDINIRIAANVLAASHRHGVRKLLNLGSSCIYPRMAPQPLQEESLLTGLLEPTNEAYAIAKIAAIKLCDAYRTQYGSDFISAMPCNLYGPNDNFDLQARTCCRR